LTAQGAFFADEIAQQFHAEEHIPYRRDEYADGPLNPYHDTEPYTAEEPVLAVA
jgi:oxygen-independent coproporphyrinogen-3 oxidase